MVALNTMMISEVVIKDSASAVADRVTAALERMADAEGRANDNAVKSSRGLEVAAAKFESYKRQIDAVYDAQTRFANVEKDIQKAVNLGAASQAEAAVVLAGHKARLDEITGAANKSTNAFHLNAQGMSELKAAGVNAFQALAAGMDPLRVASTESAQVLGAFAQGGTNLVGVLTKFALPIGLAVGALGALAYAIKESQRSLESLDDAMKRHDTQIKQLQKSTEDFSGASYERQKAYDAERRSLSALGDEEVRRANDRKKLAESGLTSPDLSIGEAATGAAAVRPNAGATIPQGPRTQRLTLPNVGGEPGFTRATGGESAQNVTGGPELTKYLENAAAGLYGDRSSGGSVRSDEFTAQANANAKAILGVADALKIEQQVAGVSIAQREILRAKLQAELEARTGGMSAAEAERLVTDRVTEAKLKQATVISDANRLRALETQLTEKTADAYDDNASAGLKAAAVQQATLEVYQRGGNVAAEAQAILKDQIEKTRLAGEQQAVSFDQQRQGAEALAAASAKGAKAEQDMQAVVKADLAVQPLKIAAAAAEGAQKEKLLALSERIRQSIIDTDAYTRTAATNQLIRAQQDQLELGQKELDLVGATVQQRAVALAQLQAEIQLRNQNANASDDEVARVKANAAALAEQKVTLDRTNAALTEIQNFGSKAFDDLGTAMVQAGQNGVHFKDIMSSLRVEFELLIAKMALLNPLKNLLLGTNLPTLFDLGGIVAGGGGAAGAAGGAAGLAGGGGFLGGAGLLGSGASLFSGGSSIFSGINSFGASTGLFGTGSGGLPGVIGTPGLLGSQTLSGFLGGVGLGFGGGALLNSIAGGNSTNGLIGSGIGAIGGTILGGPIGGLIGGSAGGLLGGFFGPGKSVGPGQAAFTNFGATGSGLGNSAIYADADNGGSAAAARAALQGPAAQLLAAMKALGITTSGFALRFDSQNGNNGYRLGLGGGQEVDLGANPTASGALLSLIQNNRLSASGSFGTALRSGGIQSEADLNDAAAISAAVDSIDKLKDALGNVKTPADQAKDAVAAIGKQFDDFEAKAAKFGLDVSGLRATEATLFNSNIQSAIDQIEDPLKAALDVEKATADARLEVARKLGADMTLVDRLNADEVKKINDQFAKNVTDTAKAVDDTLQNSLKSTLHGLIYGGDSALSPSAQYSSARASYSAAEAAALAGNAPSNFGDVASQFVSSSRALYGSSSRAAADFDRATGVLQQITGTSDGITPTQAIRDFHADFVRGQAVANDQVFKSLAGLQSQVLELQSQIARLMSASRAA